MSMPLVPPSPDRVQPIGPARSTRSTLASTSAGRADRGRPPGPIRPDRTPPPVPLPPAAVTLVPSVGRRVRLQVGPPRAAARWRPQRGQATAEYALVLLGAAAIALLLAAWAAKSGKIGQLFDAVVDQLISRAG